MTNNLPSRISKYGSDDENINQNDDDEFDEDMIEEDDNEDLDSHLDVDEDDQDGQDEDNDTPGSRPLTPEAKKFIQNSDKKKPISHNSNTKLNSTSYRGAFTWKIIKKKAQDIDKGNVVAFGTSAAIRANTNNDEMSNQQLLERKMQINKHYQGPYKKKKNISLAYSQPKNKEEQKNIFFESGYTENPIFVYENENLTRKYLKQFFSDKKSPDGIPLASDDLLKVATKILKAWIGHFKTETSFLQSEGEVLTREQTEDIISEYLEDLEVQNMIIINFTKNWVAPTSIVHDTKKKKTRMNIRLPVEYRTDRMKTVLNHEIGTHFIRRVNDKKQKWYGKKDKYDIRSCIQTEEGYAVINQYCEYALNPKKKPYLYKAALNYYMAYQAGVMSFAELYADLEQFVDDPHRRWNYTLRVKRGITDTSMPGGLYKDQVYLEGAYKILKERRNINFFALISGKISLEDLYRPFLMKILRLDNLMIPPFMRDMKKYMKGLDRIAKINFID